MQEKASEALEVQTKPAELVEAAPAMTPEALARRYNDLAELLRRNVLVDGSDYGVIPGTGDKPTLYKAGAEKLATFFGLSIEMELVDKVEDWEGGFFYYRYKATAVDRYGRTATGEGSANSREAKYRWRNVKERDYDPAVHGPGRKIQRSGRYGKYYVYQVENREPYDLVNTLQKMAQKRAYVQAVLLAVGASAFFIQDVEDLAAAGVIETSVREGEAEEGPKRGSPPPQSPPRAPQGQMGKITREQLDSIAYMLSLVGLKSKALNRRLITLALGEEYQEVRELTQEQAAKAIEYLARLTAAATELKGADFTGYVEAVLEAGELPPADATALQEDYDAWEEALAAQDVTLNEVGGPNAEGGPQAGEVVKGGSEEAE